MRAAGRTLTFAELCSVPGVDMAALEPWPMPMTLDAGDDEDLVITEAFWGLGGSVVLRSDALIDRLAGGSRALEALDEINTCADDMTKREILEAVRAALAT